MITGTSRLGIDAPTFYHYFEQWPDDYARGGWTPQLVRDDLAQRLWRGPLANTPTLFIEYLCSEGLEPMTGTLHPHPDDHDTVEPWTICDRCGEGIAVAEANYAGSELPTWEGATLCNECYAAEVSSL